MFNLPHPHRPFIATVAIVCFGTGIIGAHSAHAIDSHVAVTEAQAAAKVYEERRQKLESALSDAQAVSQQAASVTESEDVAAAVDELQEATVRAASTARTADKAAVAASGATEGDDVVAPITATVTSPSPEVTTDADAPTADSADGASESSEGADQVSSDGATTVGNTLTPEDQETTADDATASPSPEDAESSSDADSDAATDNGESTGAEATPTAIGDASTAGVEATEAQVEPDLVVDSSQFTGPDDAREAAASLTAASEQLESAAASVAAESRQLEVLAEDALLAKALSDFESAVTDAQDAAADADERIAEVGDRVADTAVLSAYASARANLRSMVSTTLDTQDSSTALTRLEALQDAVVAHADALADVRTSHEEWIDTENAERAEKNEAAEAAYKAEVAQAREDFADANRAAVAARQNGWSGQPSGVSGSNGRLTAGSLESLDFAPGHYLPSDAATALEAADAAYYAETGKHLSLTDSYRSYALQVRTRAAKPGTAAVPGTSNHGWGMAVDMDYASAKWLAANGAEFGWVHPTWARPGGSKPEWWHLEYVATEVGEFETPDEPTLLKDLVSVFDDLDDDADEN